LPAPLVITANNVARNAGQPDPAFTATYSGLVNGDGAGVITGVAFAAGDTGVSAPAGTYQITPYGATAQNYVISFVPGTLTVGSVLVNTSSPLSQSISNSSSILSQLVSNQIFTVPTQMAIVVPTQQGTNPAFPLQSVINTLTDNLSGSIGADGATGEGTSTVTCLKSGGTADTCDGSLNVKGF
jgi:hypothetical protein